MRKLLGTMAAALMLSALAVTPVGAKATGAERTPVMVQYDGDGDNGIPDGVEGTLGPVGGDVTGWSQLVRRDNGIGATLMLGGLIPGGVYTVWIGVGGQEACEEENCVPDFVANGAGFIAKKNGMATVHVSADVGDSSITGFDLLTFAPVLTETMDVPVALEIAYHGQAPGDGPVPDSWSENFWDGDRVCDLVLYDPAIDHNVNAVDGNPHCPIPFRTFHLPG